MLLCPWLENDFGATNFSQTFLHNDYSATYSGIVSLIQLRDVDDFTYLSPNALERKKSLNYIDTLTNVTNNFRTKTNTWTFVFNLLLFYKFKRTIYITRIFF